MPLSNRFLIDRTRDGTRPGAPPVTRPLVRGTLAVAVVVVLLAGGVPLVLRGSLTPPSTFPHATASNGTVPLAALARPAANASVEAEAQAIAPTVAHNLADLNPQLTWPIKLPALPNWVPVVVGVIEGAACAVGIVVTDGAALFPCLELVLVTFGAMALYDWLQSLTPPSIPLSPLYDPGVVSMNQILGAANVSYRLAHQSAANAVADLNALYGTLAYEAMSAALLQLPNATFQPNLDLMQSSILDQVLPIFDGYALQVTNITTASMRTAGALYGQSGGYGANGVVCQLGTATEAIRNSIGDPFGVYSPVVENPTTHSFLKGINGFGSEGPTYYNDACLNGFAVPSSDVWGAPVLGDESNVFGLALVNQSLVYVSGRNATVGQTWAPNWTYKFVGVTDSNTSTFTLLNNASHGVGVPRGIYRFTISGPASSGIYINTSLGEGILPVENFSLSPSVREAQTRGTSLGGFALNETPSFPTDAGGVLFYCPMASLYPTSGIFGPTALESSVYSQPYNGGSGIMITNSTHVAECGTTGGGMYPLWDGWLNVSEGMVSIAEGYFDFLHGLGIFSTHTLPPNCTALSPELPLPADTPLSQWISFSPTYVQALFAAYSYAQAESYGSSGPVNYCGDLIPPPTYISVTSPTTFLVADIFTANNGETFASRSTWLARTAAVVPFPQVANVSLVVNQTWEFPSANPVTLVYGPLIYSNQTNAPETTAINYTVLNSSNLDLYAFFANFVFSGLGNSTLLNGSEYPHATDARLGQGDALYPEECWTRANVTAKWVPKTACTFNITQVSYSTNGTADICFLLADCGSVGQGGFPLPSSECGNVIVDALAAPFNTIPILDGFACLLGWLLLIIIVFVGIYVAVRVIGAIANRRRQGTNR